MATTREKIDKSLITKEDIVAGKLFVDQADGETIMLSYIGEDQFACISIEDGNLWGSRVKMSDDLSPQTIQKLIYNSDHNMVDLFGIYGIQNLRPIELESRGW